MKHDKTELSHSDDQALAQLLGESGKREQAPEALRASVHAQVLAAYQQQHATTSTKSRYLPWAMAATVLLAVLALVNVNFEAPALQYQVAVVQGEVTHQDETGKVQILRPAQAIERAGRIYTQSGALALQLAARSLRLAPDSELQLTSNNEVRLVSGRLYFDSGSANKPKSGDEFSITTGFGSVQHIGTQYMLQYSSDGLDVLVREGQVKLQTPGKAYTAAAGSGIRIVEHSVSVIPAPAANAADWQWSQTLAGNVEIEGQPLSAFLRWAGRELGLAVIYTDPATELAAGQTILHGDVSGMNIKEALAAVMATTGYTYIIDKVITIQRQ